MSPLSFVEPRAKVADREDPKHAGSSIVDVDILRQLLRDLDGTDIDELELEIGQSRLYLRREPGQRTELARREPDGERSIDSNHITVKAPLTGVFYARENPESLPYVSPGDPVEVGQVVALIETMKLFNEVTSEVAGELVSVGAKDGDSVEVDQILFVIKPGLAESQS